MKEGINNEIDILLRKLGESQRSEVAATDDDFPRSEHLDADELNAYAENSLPEAARSFYTAHLADCEECRKMVTRLTVSAVVTVREPEAVKGQSVVQKLFSLSSSWFKLNYLVPTFAALGILVFAIVVIWRAPQSQHLARTDSTLPAATSISKSGEPAQAQKSQPGLSKGDSVAESRRTEDANKQPKSVNDKVAPGTAGQISAEDRNDVVAEGARRELDKVEREQQAKVAEEPAPVTNPPQSPSPKPVSVDQNAAGEFGKSSDVAQRKNSPAAAPPAAKSSVADDEDQKSRKAERKKQPEVTNTERSPARDVGGVASSRQALPTMRAANEKAKDDSEIRTVAGRRFRREDKKWIDTAYTSGTATVNLTRGSEQYRGLIADEPEIGKIADQLDGEVIVLWKGRAYRIR